MQRQEESKGVSGEFAVCSGQEDGFGSGELGSHHIELAGRLVAEVQTKRALNAVVEKARLPVEARCTATQSGRAGARVHGEKPSQML